MFMGVYFWAFSCLSDFLHPRPGDTVTILGVALSAKFDPSMVIVFDPMVIVFGSLFLYAYTRAINETEVSTPSTMVSKVWIVLYALVLWGLCIPTVFDPINMYIPTVGTDNWEATPKAIQMAMERVAFVFSVVFTSASTVGSIFCVYVCNKPTVPMYYAIFFWAVNLFYAQLVYPWPNVGNTVPEFADGVSVPVFTMGAIFIAMSAVCLYAENNASTALKSKKNS
jgi:hypothetical protein